MASDPTLFDVGLLIAAVLEGDTPHNEAMPIIEHEAEASRLPDEAWAGERAFIEERMKLGPLPGLRTCIREDIHDRSRHFYRHRRL